MADRKEEPRLKERRTREPPPFRPDRRIITYIEKPQGAKHPKAK